MPEWFSIHWFYLATFESFDWENPIFLYGIPLIPLFFVLRWVFHIRFEQKLEVAFFEQSLKSDPSTWLRHFPKVFSTFFMAMVLVALAHNLHQIEHAFAEMQNNQTLLLISTFSYFQSWCSSNR